jgi:endonuclease-3
LSKPSKALVLRALDVSERLKRLYPEAVCALEFGGEAWKLIVMGRLSAQCTDKRVNEVSKILFEKFPTAEALAYGDIDEIREIVRPCGLFRVKSDDIKEECRMLVEDYGGELPDTMDELLGFRGVGRKIANLLLGDVFGKGGIVADTHCIRISGRLGFYPENWKDPLKTEKIMSVLIPDGEQSDFCHRIVLFGREYCKAQSPECTTCPMADICNSVSKKA